ncbi:biopolymer transporter ExbD [Flavobacterium sp. NRK F10]|uniref:Biopolymer transporter ExbD n=1 Tax=Flavobacterium sediminis TaxID=2201181 RepID=A0A2U8QVI5_9FLAO|nr:MULTISPECIES: biopolymer transporter ExbD [Flavobacterium]AWM13805.1 biopolymer transporter ExbD [Flavobacterium sediminis]MCO6174965.1 biopolymer transporter ExbD [Flavobacterium sp. NRK F10]
MSKFKKKKSGSLPAISTASLPDIVFMLLFFFMTATTMKDSDLKIENRLPKADQTAKLHKKQYVMYIYAGKPKANYRSGLGSSDRIQLNDKISSVNDIRNFVMTERASRNSEDEKYLTASLKIDKEVKMGLVQDIKTELRKVDQLKVNYTTTSGNPVGE